MLPKVSVVLPYFNAEKTIARSVLSIIEQDYRNLEIVLVNNNSSDNSEALCAELASQDPRVVLLNEPEQGVAFAANRGIDCATGTYIARMDADDIAHTSRISQQVQYMLDHHSVDILATQVEYEDQRSESHANHTNGFLSFVEWSNSIIYYHCIYQNRFVEYPVVNPTLLFAKKVFSEVGSYRHGDFPEDYEWFLRAMDKGFVIEKLDKQLLKWVDSPTRLTRNHTSYSAEAFFRIKTNYLVKSISRNTKSVWIWGAGKLARRRSQWLESNGIQIVGYIDIKQKEVKGYPCIHFSTLKLQEHPFIISYVTNRGKREEIRAFLNKAGYKEGTNFIIAG